MSKILWKHSTPLAVLLLLPFTFSTARTDETTEPSFHAIPVSSSVGVPASMSGGPTWPKDAASGSQYFCKEYGTGCFLIEYTDPKALSTFSFLHPDVSTAMPPDQGNQFFLDDLPSAPAAATTAKAEKAREALGGRVTEEILRQAHGVLMKARAELDAQSSLSEETQKEILNHPAVFVKLPALYRDFVNTPKERAALENVINKALWLTLEGLTNSAYSGLTTFPYVNDSTVTTNNFLNTDWAMQRILELRKELPLVSLTEETRRALDPSCPNVGDRCKGFLRKNSRGAWKTLAAYMPNTNSIFVDYTGDFYEAVFAMQHELMHAVTENTKVAESFRRRVEGLAPLLLDADPKVVKGTEDALKETIYYVTIKNELNAIAESNALYRFAGHLAHQWGSTTPSAKGWYDAEYGGDEYEKLYIPFSKRMEWEKLTQQVSTSNRKFQGKVIDAMLAGMAGTTVDLFVRGHSINQNEEKQEALGAPYHPNGEVMAVVGAGFATPVALGISAIEWKKHADKENRKKLEKIGETASVLDSALAVLKKRVEDVMPPTVIQFFNERYQISLPDLPDFDQPKDVSNLEFVTPTPVHLTCDTAERIAALMPEEWGHGIPFYFVAANSDGTPCAVGPGHIPGVGGGTHGDINAVPCMSGEN